MKQIDQLPRNESNLKIIMVNKNNLKWVVDGFNLSAGFHLKISWEKQVLHAFSFISGCFDLSESILYIYWKYISGYLIFGVLKSYWTLLSSFYETPFSKRYSWL